VKYIIIDLELNQRNYKTKLNGLKNEIIEIGAIKLNSKLELVNKFQCFIKPTVIKELNKHVKEVTRIVESDLDNAKSFPFVMSQFKNWIGGEQCVLFQWSNADYNELISSCKYFNLSTNWIPVSIDLQEIYCKIYSLSKQISLAKAIQRFEPNNNFNRHSALYDAITTYKILKYLLIKN
jgi:inhibitor of KinA sporulation pathway (predicted exonuclease)